MQTIIAIGSNMGDRREYIEKAIVRIGERAGAVTARSQIIETKAYGVTNQADFLNMAVSVETELLPRQLLAVLHGIEAELDRVRLIRWGPRTIDLDIIFYGDLILDEEDLHIPHIDFANRDFVLRPVCEIAPELVDPRSGRTVSQIREEFLQKQEMKEDDPK